MYALYVLVCVVVVRKKESFIYIVVVLHRCIQLELVFSLIRCCYSSLLVVAKRKQIFYVCICILEFDILNYTHIYL